MQSLTSSYSYTSTYTQSARENVLASSLVTIVDRQYQSAATLHIHTWGRHNLRHDGSIVRYLHVLLTAQNDMHAAAVN